MLVDGGPDWPRMELVDGAVEVEQRIGAGKVRSPKALPGERWVHVAYVAFGRGQGTSKLYVDGIELAHRSGIGKTIGTDRVLVGGHLVADQEDIAASLAGAVSDFRIYEHPLSPAQIGELISGSSAESVGEE